MITLKNGKTIDFCCASGALAFDGKGWWFEQPYRWLGYLKPEAFTIIVKTLTFYPKTGNLKWWCPWRCVRTLPEGNTVNAVGLTNKGFYHWISYIYPKMNNLSVIPSIAPNDDSEARAMIVGLNEINVTAVELNISCPNVKSEEENFTKIIGLIGECYENSKHPLIVKLGVNHSIVNICKQFKNTDIVWDLINSVPWREVYENKRSPLNKYGLVGGVSGPIIKNYARHALIEVRNAGVENQIISGGGIDSEEEVRKRFELGANAIAFGTIFIKKPWLPNKIVEKLRNENKLPVAQSS